MPKGGRNPNPMYGISALERKWAVILHRNKVQFQKAFFYSTYGGRDAALAAAQAWRDEIARQHPPILKRDRAEKLISTNKSGIPGVRCRLGPDGKPQLWMAQTRVGSQRLLKSFSVGRYGDHAKSLAIAERQKHLELIKGHHSCHPADQVEPDAPPSTQRQAWLRKPVAKAEVVKSNNKTGVSGVHCRYGADGRPRAWVARTRVGGALRRKVFSVEEYGEERARALAIAERHRQLSQADPSQWSAPAGAERAA